MHVGDDTRCTPHTAVITCACLHRCCSVPATALSAALRGGKKLEKLELIDCIDIYPSDMVDLMEELFVLRNDAAPSRLVITAEPDLLHGAVDVAKQRGMWDRERSRQICVLGLKFGV